MTAAPLVYTIEEAAEQTRVSCDTIYRLIAAGKLKTIKIGRRRLVPASALVRLAEKGASLG